MPCMSRATNQGVANIRASTIAYLANPLGSGSLQCCAFLVRPIRMRQISMPQCGHNTLPNHKIAGSYSAVHVSCDPSGRGEYLCLPCGVPCKPIREPVAAWLCIPRATHLGMANVCCCNQCSSPCIATNDYGHRWRAMPASGALSAQAGQHQLGLAYGRKPVLTPRAPPQVRRYGLQSGWRAYVFYRARHTRAPTHRPKGGCMHGG